MRKNELSSSNLLNAKNFIRHVGIYYLKLILLMRDTAEMIGDLLTEMLLLGGKAGSMKLCLLHGLSCFYYKHLQLLISEDLLGNK